MLAGEAVVAIWNGIAPDGRVAFYDWHLREHMPERVGIPGFLRGRRYIAMEPDTQPEFFTLYEVATMQVLQGSDYTNRLNAPTALTKSTTAHFRDTSRALARVLDSSSPGMGGVLLSVRFAAAAPASRTLADAVRAAGCLPRITGAHLCVADDASSGASTAESKGRTDIQPPPGWFALLEATDAEALRDALTDATLLAAGARGDFRRGLYRLEHVRSKTAFSA
jgi:hypothetical protein